MHPRSILLAAALAVTAGCAERAAAPPPFAATPAEPLVQGPGRPAELQHRLDAAREAWASGRLVEARDALVGLAADAPADPEPLLALAEVRYALNERAEALRDADRALALRETPAALALRGRLRGIARRFDEAAADLERSLARLPGAARAWVALAAVQVNRGDEAGRDRALEAARRLLGAQAGADAFWTQLLSMAPDQVQPQESLDRCTRGYVAMMDGQWVDAQREQLAALRYAPRFHWCLAGVAETTWRLGDAARGEQLLRRVIADYPPAQDLLRADAKARLAALLLEGRRDAGEAARLLREALAVRGDRTALLQRLGQACEAIDDDACERDAEARLARLTASAR